MLIVCQNKKTVINLDNIYSIEEQKEYGGDKEINVVKAVKIIAKCNNGHIITIATYKTEKEADYYLNCIINYYRGLEFRDKVYNINDELPYERAI